MGGDATKVLNSALALQPNMVQSLDVNGFTLGTSANVNAAGQTYYWTALKAGAELKLGSYVGNGVDNRSITGVGFQPVWVLTMGDGNDSWFRPATLAGDASYRIVGTGSLTNRIQALEPDGFQVGSNLDVNGSGITYHYVAWNTSANVTQSSYTGNSADSRSITGVGFQPLMAWVKRNASDQGTWRPSSVSGDLSLLWDGIAAASDHVQALEADGFQVGTNARVNLSANIYHYLALKDGGP